MNAVSAPSPRTAKRQSAPLRWPQLLACAYALLATFLCHAHWMPRSFLAALLATIVLRVILRKRSARRVPWWLKLPLIVGFGALVVQHFSNLFGREAGSALLAAMLALKLLETETRRDGLLLLAVACFLAMCGFLANQSIPQAVTAALALAVILASLNALQPLPDDAPAEARRDTWWPYADLGFGSLARPLALALPFAIACFEFFPRLDRPLWGAPEDAFKNRTGISETMRPGSLSDISLDDSTAFRVSFEGQAPPPASRYYRVLTMVDYDGVEWRASNWTPTRVNQRAQALAPATNYEILMEATDQHWMPMLDVALAPPPDAMLDAAMQVSRANPITASLRYRGSSATSYRLQTLAPRFLPAATRLPPRAAPRARALVQQWRDAGLDSPAVVQAALTMFNESFSYTLDPAPPRGDPIDDFLFDTKAGFCEHFAGSFTVLMRAAGIPSRVVIGYLGGYFNPVGGFYTVRNSDAHAWAEVWLDDERGWTRVDPTGAVAPERITQGSARARAGGGQEWFASGDAWLSLRDRLDLAAYWWNRAVVEFSALRQRDMLQALGFDKHNSNTLTLLFVTSALVALALAGWLGSRRRPPPLDPTLMAYRRYCERLARAGVARKANEGPLDFADRAALALPGSADSIRSLGAEYVRLRYAANDASGADAAAWRRQALRFRVATKRAAGAS